MSKTITISVQTLNNLYFKFLNNCILPYVPKNIQTDVNNLLGLKSPIEVFKYLDNLVSSKIQEKKQHKSTQQKKTQKSNISQQGSHSYASKDDFKYFPSESSPNSKKGLKRTQTYLAPDQTNQKLLEDLKSLNANKQENGLKFNHNNFVKHDYDTYSQKHHPNLGKKQSNDSGNEIYQFKVKKQSQIQSQNKYNFLTKQRIQQPQSAGYKKIEFTKSYSIRQLQKQPVSLGSQNSSLSQNKINSIVKSIKQVFKENQKKIQRYQKISTVSTAGGKNQKISQSIQQEDKGNMYMYKKY